MGFMIVVLIILRMLLVVGWSVCSFWLGYTVGRCWLIAVPVMVVILLIYIAGSTGFFSYAPSASTLADIISDISTMVVFGIVLFGAGIFARYGIHKDGYIQILSFINILVMGFITIYFALAFTNERSRYVEEKNLFWTSVYDDVQHDNTVLIRDNKLRLNPLPAKIVAVFKYNDKGNYCGWSTSPSDKYIVVNNRFDEKHQRKITGKATFVHTRYLPAVMAFMADCHDAIYKKRYDLTVFLYMKDDTLHRKELEYHQNGIIREMRSYTHKGLDGFEIDNVVQFDELGYNDSDMSFDNLWNYNDFIDSAEHLDIESKFGTEYTVDSLNYTDNQRYIIKKYISVESNYNSSDTTKTATSLDVPLDEYYQLGNINSKYIYVYIDRNEYTRIYPKQEGFKSVKSTQDAQDIINALELSSLETGMWVGLGEQSMFDGECFRIMISEGKKMVDHVSDSVLKKRAALKNTDTKTDNLVIYLFNEYAITADSRFMFRRSLKIDQDKTEQRKCDELWTHIFSDIY